MPTDATNTEVTGTATHANRDPERSTSERDYERSRIDGTLTWEKASREAWNCLENVRTDDANGAGRLNSPRQDRKQ